MPIINGPFGGTGGTGGAPSTGSRDYGPLSAAPTSPTPADGDIYYNTVGKFKAVYNGTYWVPSFTPGQSFALTGGSTVNWDCSVYPSAEVTLTASGWTLSPSNMVVGGKYQLTVRQDSTGGRTFIFPSSISLCRGPLLASSTVTTYTFVCVSAGVLQLVSDLGWRKKVVTGTTYTLALQDHKTTLSFTNASAVAVTGLASSGLSDFEFEIEQAGAGVVTFTPNGSEKVFWDYGVPSGSSSFSTINQFDIQRLRNDGSGWYLR